MDRFDPWKKKKSKFLLQPLVELYIKDGKKAHWSSKASVDTAQYRLTKMMDYIPPNSVIANVKNWDWFSDLPLALNTKKGLFSSTRAFLNWCKKNKYLEDFTLELSFKIKKAIQNKVTRYITHQQLTFIGKEYIKLHLI